jgi:CIC family chloride channel protein
MNSKLLESFLIWREKHISHRQFVYLLSFVIGLISGLAAVILKNAVLITHYFLSEHVQIDKLNYLYLFFPLQELY